ATPRGGTGPAKDGDKDSPKSTPTAGATTAGASATSATSPTSAMLIHTKAASSSWASANSGSQATRPDGPTAAPSTDAVPAQGQGTPAPEANGSLDAPKTPLSADSRSPEPAKGNGVAKEAKEQSPNSSG